MDIVSVKANFLAGPVALAREVSAAFQAPAVSHRDPAFLEMMTRTRASLGRLVHASHVALLVGSGTLANDAVAAQLQCAEGTGLILSNGEFGERLIDHAIRSGLAFTAEQQDWGRPFDWRELRQAAARRRPNWVWAVLSETSTGVINPLYELITLANGVGAQLCLDAISAVGLMPVNLRGVRFATAVSGKGLAAPAGLAAVFHHGQLAPSGHIPRYLDLASYESADGVPFTHSSNLLAALDRSLSLTCWPQKFELVKRESVLLRAALRSHGVPPLASDADAAPGIITVPLVNDVSACDVANELARLGFQVAFQSRYLRQRNWLQICLMGQLDETALRRLPGVLAKQVMKFRTAASPRRELTPSG